jgi:CheY-like chemotaxis protein
MPKPPSRVLLVEDNASVRECLIEVLQQAGLLVFEAPDAAQALGLAEAAGAPEVLVADVNLGAGLNGPALVAAARQRWPGLRVVLISGEPLGDRVLGPHDSLLAKPFRAAALLQAVRG